MSIFRTLMIGVSSLLVLGCSDDPEPGGGAGAAGSSSVGGGTQGGSAGIGGASGTAATPAGSFVYFDTPIIEHDRDYHDFRPYQGPDVPTNWLEPINYADGTYTLALEIVEMTDPMAVPFYYTVGFKAGSDASPAGYARTAFKVEDPKQIYEMTRPVKGIQKVVDGVDAGEVGDDWDWTDPFDHPRGDMWGTTFPIKVKVKMVVHPAVESTGLHGAQVPSGVYDRDSHAWKQSTNHGGGAENGVALEITSISGGLGQVDAGASPPTLSTGGPVQRNCEPGGL